MRSSILLLAVLACAVPTLGSRTPPGNSGAPSGTSFSVPPTAFIGGCPADESELYFDGDCNGDPDQWELMFHDDEQGGMDWDEGEGDEDVACVGGHDVCPECDYQNPSVVHPPRPQMWSDPEYITCTPGEFNCVDGYVGWDLSSEEVVSQQTCGVQNCWKDITSDYVSGESGEYYYYCTGEGK